MKRIKYINSIFEIIFTVLPFLLSLLIFICLKKAYPFITNFLSENGVQNSDILSYFIDIGIFIISSIPLLFSLFKSFPKRIKALAYRGILRIYSSCHSKWLGLICSKLINIFFKVKRVEIREQNTIVTELLNLLKDSDNGPRIVFLTGSAYSGKTTTILMFLEELILNRNYSALYEKMGHKIYYYDFDSNFSFESFNNDYVMSKYDNSILIIDNLHRESEKQFIQTIDLILSAGNKAYGIFVLFRKPEEFLINQTMALNIYNSISDYCISVENNKALTPLNDKKVFYTRFNEIKFQSFINSIGFSKINITSRSVIYMHLYKIFQFYLKFHNRKVFYVFDILQGKVVDFTVRDAIIVIIMLCQYVGKFSREDYYNVMKALGYGRFLSANVLNTLLSINFIEYGWYEMHSNQFILHEETAKVYLDYILQNASNYNIVVSVNEILYDSYQNTNILLAWYYSLLCRNSIIYNNHLFDLVLNQANIKSMLAAIGFYWKYMKNKPYSLYREYGVLNSIAGNEDLARRFLLHSFRLHPTPEVLLELFEVKHRYYLEFEETIQKISINSNPYVNLGISYWKKHINMHLGNFDFLSYSSDASLILENMYWIQEHEPYEGEHLLRRWYFDYFKIFFLVGILNYNKINQNENSALFTIRSVLKTKNKEFEYYNNVYVLADYIQYVLLFKMRLKKIYPNKAELEFIGKLNEEEAYFTQCKLQDYAKELYDNSIQLMKKNGDHAYWHVINREIDLMLQNDSCDFEMVEAMLECYMQHAFEIRCYEYVAYAHMFLMKTKLIRQLVYAHEEEKNTQIKEHIENFRRYYHKHNPFRKNLYAEIRLKLFEAILIISQVHYLHIVLSRIWI